MRWYNRCWVVWLFVLIGWISCRGSISIICENLKSALGLLNELKTEVTNKNSTLDLEMDKLQNILTPTQRAKVVFAECYDRLKMYSDFLW